MKSLYPSLTLAAALALASCAPSLTPLDDTVTKTQASANNGVVASINTPLGLSFDGAIGTNVQFYYGSGYFATLGDGNHLRNTTSQTFSLQFGRNLDATTVTESSFKFYTLADSVDGVTPSVATALAATPTFSVKDNVVAITVDLSSATSTVELRIAADVFKSTTTNKGNPGLYQLDPNGNGVPGEKGEVLFVYLPVYTNSASGATAPSAVNSLVMRNPTATVPVVFTGLLATSGVKDVSQYNASATGTSLSLTWADTVGGAKVTLDKTAFDVLKNVAGVWTSQDYTLVTDTAAKTTILNLTTAPVAGEAYRITYKPYNVVESEALGELVHRASYVADNSSWGDIWVTFANPNPGSVSVTRSGVGSQAVGTGNNQHQRYIDVSVPSVYHSSTLYGIDWSTVSSATIKVQTLDPTWTYRGQENQYYVVPVYSFLDCTFEKLATATTNLGDGQVQKFRIWLNDRYSSSYNYPSVYLWFAPSVLTKAVEGTSYDKLSFGQTDPYTNQNWPAMAGWGFWF